MRFDPQRILSRAFFLASTHMNWMIYDANGYTGELIAREAKHRRLKPILAGRSADKVAALATELDCECRAFGINNPDQMVRQLQGVGLVLHCAGPFSATSAPMITACLEARAHYLDLTVTGSLAVIDFLTRNQPAGGSYTLAKLMGADLVTRLPGSGSMTIE